MTGSTLTTKASFFFVIFPLCMGTISLRFSSGIACLFVIYLLLKESLKTVVAEVEMNVVCMLLIARTA